MQSLTRFYSPQSQLLKLSSSTQLQLLCLLKDFGLELLKAPVGNDWALPGKDSPAQASHPLSGAGKQEIHSPWEEKKPVLNKTLAAFPKKSLYKCSKIKKRFLTPNCQGSWECTSNANSELTSGQVSNHWESPTDTCNHPVDKTLYLRIFSSDIIFACSHLCLEFCRQGKILVSSGQPKFSVHIIQQPTAFLPQICLIPLQMFLSQNTYDFLEGHCTKILSIFRSTLFWYG